MKVVSINDSKNKNTDQRKEEMLQVIDNFREQIEAGEITEFVSISSRTDGAIQLHVGCFDVVTAIGMFGIGKHLVLNDFEF